MKVFVSLVSFLHNEQKLASSQTASLQRPVRGNECMRKGRSLPTCGSTDSEMLNTQHVKRRNVIFACSSWKKYFLKEVPLILEGKFPAYSAHYNPMHVTQLRKFSFHSTQISQLLHLLEEKETCNFWPMLLMIGHFHSQNRGMFYENFPQGKIKVVLCQLFMQQFSSWTFALNWVWYWWWFSSAIIGYAPFLLQMVLSQVHKIVWEADNLLQIDSYPNSNYSFLTFTEYITKYWGPVVFNVYFGILFWIGVVFVVGGDVLYFRMSYIFKYTTRIRLMKLSVIWRKMKKEKNPGESCPRSLSGQMPHLLGSEEWNFTLPKDAEHHSTPDGGNKIPALQQ